MSDWQKEMGFRPVDEYVKIYYKPEAYIKITQLIQHTDLEIGWDMTVSKYQDGYLVSDVFVYPQKVSAGYIDVDSSRYGMWKAGLSEEVDAMLNGQGHSHVRMAVSPSVTDIEQQQDETSRHNGFFLFQIWNKRHDVRVMLYDIDQKLVYNKAEHIVLFETGTLFDFLKESYNTVEIRKAEQDESYKII